MKKALGIIAGIALTILFLVFAIIPEHARYLLDCASNPWAHSLTGQPTLTGHWRGKLNFEGRPGREMSLEIRRDPLVSHRRATRGKYGRAGLFSGSAKMPDERGNMIDYEVWGKTDRSGSDVRLNFRPLNQQPAPEKQPILLALHGVWQGTTLKLDGEYSIALFYDGGSIGNSDDPVRPITGTMSRQ
ncbi:MAG: hypothetical protein ACKVZH_10010 [Blastocatellia bacterium]